MKKLAVLLLFVLCFLQITGCKEVSDITDQVLNIAQTENENVISIKNAENSNCPGVTYGEAFEKFFSMPTWKYFEGTQGGEDKDGDGIADTEKKTVDVVEFTGYCVYQNVEVKALIQFVLNKEEGTFRPDFLSFNDVPQNNLILGSLLEKAFLSAKTGSENNISAEENVETESQDNGKAQDEDAKVNNGKKLYKTFTQVGLYDHEEYSYLDPEYIPTIYLYDDNTFEFRYNYYEGLGTYEGTWSVNEDEVSADYYFIVENHQFLKNFDFYVYHNKEMCDAQFYSDWDDIDPEFGMTSVEDVLFHVE